MKMFDIASRMAGFLAGQVGLEKSKTDTVRFGLEIILGEAVKWVMLLGLAVLLGVLPGVLLAMISMAVFRIVSGGAHCEDYWRCLVFGTMIFVGGAKFGFFIKDYLIYEVLLKLTLAGSLVMLVAVLIWAPGEVPNRKINKREKKLFKRLSAMYLIVWTTIVILVIAPRSIAVTVAGMVAMIVQTFSFTPPGYAAIDLFDISLSRILGERRCSAHAENT